MKTYEYEVKIIETHFVYVDAETEEEASQLAQDVACSDTPDCFEIHPNLLSVEEYEDS